MLLVLACNTDIILCSCPQVALVHGCIPVIMMDGVKNEFEEQLPLMEYTVRIPGYMAYRTPNILDELVTSGKAAQMQVSERNEQLSSR
jgi:hypothetical protein